MLILDQYNFYYSGDVTQVGPFMSVVLTALNKLYIYYIDSFCLAQVLALLTSNICTNDNIGDVILQTQFLSEELFNSILSTLNIPGTMIVHRIPGFGGNYTYDDNLGYDTVGVWGE